ncbi:MAG: hypothetical protein U0R49_01665 [Fimbriimonadales bacterium]
MTILLLLPLLTVPDVEMVPVSPVFELSLSQPPGMGPQIEIRNDSASAVEMWTSGYYPNHRWSMTTELGTPVKLTKIGEIGAGMFRSLARDKNASFLIASGKEYRYSTPPLTAAFELEPGTYTLHVMYHEKVNEKSHKAILAGVPDRLASPKLWLVCPPIKVIVTP